MIFTAGPPLLIFGFALFIVFRIAIFYLAGLLAFCGRVRCFSISTQIKDLDGVCEKRLCNQAHGEYGNIFRHWTSSANESIVGFQIEEANQLNDDYPEHSQGNCRFAYGAKERYQHSLLFQFRMQHDIGAAVQLFPEGSVLCGCLHYNLLNAIIVDDGSILVFSHSKIAGETLLLLLSLLLCYALGQKGIHAEKLFAKNMHRMIIAAGTALKSKKIFVELPKFGD